MAAASRIILIVAMLLTSSCGSLAPTFPKKLVDGCYYADGRAIFKIAGEQGQVLVPGDVKTFRVRSGGNPFRAYATFTPGFLFDGAEPAPSRVLSYGERTYSMKAGTSVPTVEMHWLAYGDEDVSLGRPC